MKFRIIKTPKDNFEYQEPVFKEGGNYAGQDRSGNAYSLNIGYGNTVYSPLAQSSPFSTTSSLTEVPREESNIEAEKGETLVRTNPDGSASNFNIGGKPHSAGGTPLIAQPQDFIFSNTQSLKIKNPQILAHFNKGGKKSLTPADISKQYKLNEYYAILNDPNSDKLQKKTAQLNIDNALGKLQDLATVQEVKKGLPNGIPQITASAQGNVIGKYGGQYQAGGSPFVYASPPLTPGQNPNWNKTWDPIGDEESAAAEYSNSWRNPATWKDSPTYVGSLPTTADWRNPANWGKEDLQANQPGFPETFIQDKDQPGLPNTFTRTEGVPNTTPYFREKDTSLLPPELGPLTTSGYKNYGASRANNLARLAAAYALANTQRYTPYIAPVPEPELIHPVYASADREIAAIQENAKMLGDIAGLSSRGSRNRSIYSSLQGNTIPAVGNAIAKYNTGNIETQNRVAEKNADTLNKYNFEKAARLSGLSNLSNEFDSRYRDAINQRLGNLAQTEKVVEGDIAHINALNATNPNFEYDPRTKTIKFKSGTHSLGNKTGSGLDQDSFMKTQIARHKANGATQEQAWSAAHKEWMALKSETTSSPYNNKSTIRTSRPTYMDPEDYS